jgi:hypothetical protein
MMAKKTSRSEPAWDRKRCLRCGGPANIGYDGPWPSMLCDACAGGLFQVVAQSRTVLVPLPDDAAADDTDTPVAASADSAPRATRKPRPRVRLVPLYEPLTDELRRRFRRDS